MLLFGCMRKIRVISTDYHTMLDTSRTCHLSPRSVLQLTREASNVFDPCFVRPSRERTRCRCWCRHWCWRYSTPNAIGVAALGEGVLICFADFCRLYLAGVPM